MNISELQNQVIYWEDLNPGTVYSSPTRTITESDVAQFGALTGDLNRLHVDKEYAKTTIHGQRIAHGMLVASYAAGLSTRMLLNQFMEPSLLGLLNMEVRFPKATYIGDTIQLFVEVKEKRETSKPERGIVTFHRWVENQKGETMLEGEWKLLIKRQP